MKKEILFTIKDLYDWACKQGVENYLVLTNDEGGMSENIVTNNIDISKEDEKIYL